jgi:SAM-dependent methyltransferase
VSSLRAVREWVDLEKESLDSSLREVAGLAKGRLLDVGCGDKPYRSLFAPYVSEHLGVDFAPTYDGSVNAQRGGADLVYEGEALPFASGEFDTVLCTQVLEHAPRPRDLLAECARVLRPDGVLIVTVPFSFRIHSAPHDYVRFTSFGLRAMVQDAGFVVERLHARGGLWRVVGQKVASYLALRVARLGAKIQEAGGLTYVQPATARPRYWTLPIVAPAIVLVVALARALDRLDRDESDTLGYVLVARPAPR